MGWLNACNTQSLFEAKLRRQRPDKHRPALQTAERSFAAATDEPTKTFATFPPSFLRLTGEIHTPRQLRWLSQFLFGGAEYYYSGGISCVRH